MIMIYKGQLPEALDETGFRIFFALPDAILTFPSLTSYMFQPESTVVVSIWTDSSGLPSAPGRRTDSRTFFQHYSVAVANAPVQTVTAAGPGAVLPCHTGQFICSMCFESAAHCRIVNAQNAQSHQSTALFFSQG
jgi:hypothetical protein